VRPRQQTITTTELRQACRARGLTPAGTKEALIERLSKCLIEVRHRWRIARAARAAHARARAP
jgi:hypothetical protein